MQYKIKPADEVRKEDLLSFINKTLDGMRMEDRTEFRLYDAEKLPYQDWLDALRSGRFAQANGQLRVIDATVNPNDGFVYDMTNAYCCLGVLLDVISSGWCDSDDDIVSWMEPDPGEEKGCFILNENVNHIHDDGNGTLINEDFAEEIGFFEVAQSLLSGLNDNGATFEEIAAIVEANDIRAIIDFRDELERS
jgi:hypothetical protein